MIENVVLNLMIEQGGSFNRKLAELYRIADSENSKKLEIAFSDIFENFKKLSDKAKSNDQ
jgi:hypothetical protein